MGIRFDDAGANATPATTDAVIGGSAVEVQAPGGGITLDLSKGVTLDLSKAEPGLKLVTLAAGWDVADTGASFDIDISAFLLNASKKIGSAADIIYFRNMQGTGIRLNGDNTTGEGEGDDETIDIDLTKIPDQYTQIDFVVNIYDAMTKKQTFGMVNSSYVRLLNKEAGDKEICRFSLKDEYSTSTAVIVARLVRDGGNWKFETVGEGKVVKDLNDIAAIYS